MTKSRGGRFLVTQFPGIFALGLLMLAGCGSPPAGPGDPNGDPEVSLAGTWDRNDGRQTIVIGQDGSVITESLALDVASTYRNILPADGTFHQLSSAPENGVLSQLQVLIGAYKFNVDADQKITVDNHRFAEQWVTDDWPCMDITISGTGLLTSPTTMEIEFLKQPLGIRQKYTYSKTGE